METEAEYWGSSPELSMVLQGSTALILGEGPVTLTLTLGGLHCSCFTHTFAQGWLLSRYNRGEERKRLADVAQTGQGWLQPHRPSHAVPTCVHIEPWQPPWGKVLKPWGRPKPSPLKNKSIYSEHCDFKQQNKICHSDQGQRCPRRCIHPM